MSSDLPAMDDYIEIFGRQWDCQNIIPVDRYVDDIKTEANKFVTKRYYLVCSSTKESIALDESNFKAVIKAAGGKITRAPPIP